MLSGFCTVWEQHWIIDSRETEQKHENSAFTQLLPQLIDLDILLNFTNGKIVSRGVFVNKNLIRKIVKIESQLKCMANQNKKVTKNRRKF